MSKTTTVLWWADITLNDGNKIVLFPKMKASKTENVTKCDKA